MRFSGGHTIEPCWRELAVQLPLVALMCACSVYPFVASMELQQGVPEVLALSVLFATIGSAVFSRKWSSILAAAALAAVAAAVAALALTPDQQDGSLALMRQQWDSYLYWLSNHMLGRRVVRVDYARFTATLFNALVTFAVCLFTVRKARFFGAVLPGIAVFTALFAIGHEIHLPSLAGFIFSATLFIWYSRFRLCSRAVSPGQKTKPTLFLLSSLPAALVALSAAMVLSAAYPVDPDWMRAIRDRQSRQPNPAVEYVSKSNGAVVSTTELGGAPLLDDTVLMEVVSDTSDVYLRGISKDTYTGHSWEQSDTEPESFYVSSVLDETLESGFSLLDRDHPVNRSCILKEIKIKYRSLSTNVIYLPGKTGSFAGLSPTLRLMLVGGDTVMLKDGNAPESFDYALQYIYINRDHESFLAFARNLHPGYYDGVIVSRSIEMQRIHDETQSSAGIGADINSELENNEVYQSLYTEWENSARFFKKLEEIKNRFLRVPASIPPRVKDLSIDVTKNEANAYDKAMAIARYLSQNYTYTLTPGYFDRSKDFVDQFLFESKEGYCTYFATAMAVMLRCAGIPSRYVEGYVLPPDPSPDGTYHVTKRQGHAWVEAYFEGLGWVPFEPTSSYANGSRPDFSAQPTASAALPSATAPQPTPAPPDDSSVPGEAAVPAGKINLLIPLVLLACALFLGTGYAVPFFAGKRMKALEPKQAVLLAFRQCLTVLAAQGFEPENSEPLAVFAQRASQACGVPVHKLSQAVDAFLMARFSQHEITCDQKRQVINIRTELLDTSIKKLGVARYLYYRWIWG